MAEKDKESKKRKRLSNGVPAPSKKVALDGGSRGGTGGKINVTHIDDNGLHPVLISAPGVNAPKVNFMAYSKPTRSAVGGPVKPSTHNLLLQSSQHPKLDYVAAPSAVDEHLKHYVCAFDPTSGTLQVAEAHQLSLRSTLRSEAQEMEHQRLTNVQQREELGREFGTKKARKAIASKADNAILADKKGNGKTTDVQAAILESVGATTAGIAAKASAKEQSDALLAAKPIPRPNLEAKTVEDVYSFDTLIPPTDATLIRFKDWQDKHDAGEDVHFTHQYPAGRFKYVLSGDDTQRKKALKYLTLLLEFQSILSGGGRGGKKVPKKEFLQKKLPASRWPEGLVDSVRRRFTDDSGQTMGKWQMDNLYTHICALALFCDYWQCDIYLLKEDMKLDMKQVTQYFQELGCKVNKPTETERNQRQMSAAQSNATRIAKLKLPLDFPKARAGRRA